MVLRIRSWCHDCHDRGVDDRVELSRLWCFIGVFLAVKMLQVRSTFVVVILKIAPCIFRYGISVTW